MVVDVALPPLVVPGVARFTVMGSIASRKWANVFDVDFGSAAPVGGGVLKGLAEKLMDCYATSIATDCVTAWRVEACRWIDLNSALGETGYINDTPLNVFPKAGLSASAPFPANVSILLRKGTQGARNHRNGRNYFCGAPESTADGNTLSSSGLADWNTNAQNLNEILTGSTAGISHIFVVAGRDKNLVVHKSVVASYAADSTVATQRRRLRS